MKKSSFYFNLFSTLFWIVVMCGGTSGVGYDTGYNGGFYIDFLIWDFLIQGFPVSNGYRGVELGIIFYSIFLLWFYRGKYSVDKRNFKFLVLACIVFTFILINPNNSATLSQCFFGKDSKFIILFPLFFSSICFLNISNYIEFVKKFLQIGFWVILIKSAIAFAFYIFGKGIPLSLDNGTYNTTMPMSDYLQFLGFFSSLLMGFFLLYKNKRELITSLFLFLVMALSLRRTDPIATITCLILIFFYYSYHIGSILNFVRISISIVTFVIVLFLGTSLFTNINFSSVVNRMLVAFSYFDKDLGNKEFQDSGHINQSVETTRTVISNLNRFWGSGLQNTSFYVTGQSAAAPHNSFALAWAKQGLFAMIFLAYQLFLFLSLIINLLISHKNYHPEFKLFLFIILLQLIMYIITGWSSGRYIFQGSPQDYILFTIMFSLLKIKNDHIKYVLT